jgi:hypothetical protein
MKILNRGFINIKPTALFLEWKNEIIEEELIESENQEATTYLIEDDFWEDEDMINKYSKKIASQEFFSICENKNQWPDIKDLEQFNHYFIAECGTFVIDLLKTPIDGDVIDL